MHDLAKRYAALKPQIDARLAGFVETWEAGDAAVFQELCFCTCTPQNDAHRAWDAVCALTKTGTLATGTEAEIAKSLRAGGVRFHNNKAHFIVENRAHFYPDVRRALDALRAACTDDLTFRNTLAATMRGWGLKEASHFMRNVGAGSSLCILDRHILRCLVQEGVLSAYPPTLTKSVYLAIEQKMLAFARSEHIPADALDFLFWYEEKGELFK
jgi:N-glycosylase/DNA lyase